MLQADHVSFAYRADRPVLKDVSLRAEPGQVLYLLGRNGSGKTTLMSCLAGILKPKQGNVKLEGRALDTYAPPERARLVGIIPQIHESVFSYSVREMVLMGRAPHLGLFGAPGDDDYDIAEQALNNVGMATFGERPYTDLSGGERQLVMIARGLAQRCQYLLMDEPDAHLDPNNQHRVMRIVRDLAGRGLSFIVSSHAPNNALTYADRVLLLSKGHMLANGPVEETLTEPLLSAAYQMDTEVIYETKDGVQRPRAILPR